LDYILPYILLYLHTLILLQTNGLPNLIYNGGIATSINEIIDKSIEICPDRYVRCEQIQFIRLKKVQRPIRYNQTRLFF